VVMDPPSTESPGVCLHGGFTAFDRHIFETVKGSDVHHYQLFSHKEKEVIKSLSGAVVFKHTSPAGDEGFPNALYFEILVAVAEAATPISPFDPEERGLGSLIMVYRARLSHEHHLKTFSPVNFTQHWGFNLDASLVAGTVHPTPDVKSHLLTIKASNTIELQTNGLATGKLLPTAGTPYEHNNTPIGQNFPAKGYDEYYMFDSPVDQTPSRVPLTDLATIDSLTPLVRSSSATPPVTLLSKISGLRLTFESNQPGAQLWTANSLTGAGTRKLIHGGSKDPAVGDGYKPCAAAFVEFHEPLAAWMHPWGQAPGKDTLLMSTELYNNYKKVNIYYKKPADPKA